MLELNNVHAQYGYSRILHGVTLNVQAGEVVALIGRNGVGKTTTAHTITGLLRPSEGSITFKGVPIQGEPSYKRARMGISVVPQGRGIYPNLSVREHLLLPAKRSGSRKDEWSLSKIYRSFPQLKDREGHSGTQLSGGEQQMLSISRALMMNPDLLLLDEPSEGLAPIMVQQVGEILGRLKESALSILLIEQNLQLALSVSDRVFVMNKGSVAHEAKSSEFAKDAKMQQRLLSI